MGSSSWPKKIETPEQYEFARQLGYDYFQGYFFCKPEMLSARRLPESNIQSLRLLQLVGEPGFDIDKVEELIRGDISLSYKLLRYLNSPIFRRQSPVQSVRHAIITLGQQPLRKWVSVIAIQAISAQKPLELMNTSLIRARFNELLCERVLEKSVPSECFIAGMFSLLDAMLDQPMSEIVAELNLSDDVRLALLRQESPIRSIVELAVAMENGEWDGISRLTALFGIEEAEAFLLHSESIAWANQMQPGASESV